MLKKKPSKKIDDMLFATVTGALEWILKTEYKTPKDGGGESIDYEMTTRMMKSRARLVLDFIATVDSDKRGVK